MSVAAVNSGTAEADWHGALRAVPRWDLPAKPGLVVVLAPHPDDETLGAGALIVTLLDAGWRACVVAVTDGEAAFSKASKAERKSIARVRRAEQLTALSILRGDAPASTLSVVRLGLPDGDVAASEAILVAGLQPLLEGADLCVAPLSWDGHPDHEAVGRAAVSASPGTPRLEYPIWAWHWAPPAAFPIEHACRVDLGQEAGRRKAGALRCYQSQYLPHLGQGPILSPDVVAHFRRPYEVFLV